MHVVDIHTHMVPSGDDGVKTIEDALALCSEAASRGTSLLYGTPHVNDELPLTSEREAAVHTSATQLGELLEPVGLELRVGYELHPTVILRETDLRRYCLDRFDAVLLECPLESGPRYGLDNIFAAAERLESVGLVPVLAHPERSPAFLTKPSATADAARRGWLLQVTAASLLGRNGTAITRLAWSLVEQRRAGLVASDAHRPDRPPFLDEVFRLLVRRLGPGRAAALLDGSALDIAAASSE